MKIKAKKGKLLIISDLNITIMDESVIEITEEEFNNSKDIKVFKNDIEIVEGKTTQTAEKTAPTAAKTTVTNDGTVVTAGQVIDKAPKNVFVAAPTPTADEIVHTTVKQEIASTSSATATKEESTVKADTAAEVKPTTEVKTEVKSKMDVKADEVSKADEQKVTASEAQDVPAASKSGKRGRPSKK